MPICMCRGESGGHGLSTQSSVYAVLIGCSGGDIVGSIGIDIEFLATVRCRSHAAMSALKTFSEDL